MKSLTIKDIKVGDSATFTKTVTEADVVNFGGVCGDFNPAHFNAAAASKGMFGQRIAHGMLSASFISTAIGTELPGAGTIYMGQNLKFMKPVLFGDTITATVSVDEILDEAKGRVKLKTVCTNQNGDVVIDGDAMVICPKESQL